MKILFIIDFCYTFYIYSESLLKMQYKLVKFLLINVESEEIFDWKYWKMAAILNLKKIVKTRGFAVEFLHKNKVNYPYFTFQVLKLIINN